MVPFILFLIGFLICCVSSAYTSILGSSDCTTCAFSIWNYKICVPDFTTDSRFCCDKREHNYFCGDSKEGMCHIDRSGHFPNRSAYFLCPQERECNSRYYKISNDTEISISNSTILPGAACYQIIELDSSDFDGFDLSNFTYENVNVSVYSRNGTYSYVLEDDLTNKNSLKLSLESSKQLYILAVSNSQNVGKLSFNTKLYKNSPPIGITTKLV